MSAIKMEHGNIKFILLACFIISLWTIISAHPKADREPLGVKGGVKGGVHSAAENVSVFFGKIPNTRNLTGSSSTFNNGSTNVRKDYEKGVCYEEVLTITLVKDPNHVPAGNGSTPEYSKVRKCCPGYERNIHNFRICEPVCEHECINAKCIAPNTCACFPDHVLNWDGFCVATCPIGCLNGHCGPDKECVCDQGFTEEPNMKFCVPKCSKGCVHGNCSAPEVCTCEAGYQANGHGECVPKCDDGCVNGRCTAPNTCECNKGYEKILGKCSPICERGCHQGECIAPNVCSCGDGYQMDETETACIAHCSHPCLNGDCTGPNECTCRKGYVKDLKDSTGAKCVGHCPNGCPNGVCSGPNLCLCLPGYAKERGVKGSQACVRRLRRSLAHPLIMLIE